MRLRPARAADLTALLALEQEFPGDRLTRRSFRHLLCGAHADVWVCAESGVVLGNAVVLYRRGSRTARLYSLVVARSARGRGIGQSLVARAERSAAAAGCDSMCLEVRTDNAAALALYGTRGYEVAVRANRYYQDGADAFRLRKPLVKAASRRPRSRRAPLKATPPIDEHRRGRSR